MGELASVRLGSGAYDNTENSSFLFRQPSLYYHSESTTTECWRICLLRQQKRSSRWRPVKTNPRQLCCSSDGSLREAGSSERPLLSHSPVGNTRHLCQLYKKAALLNKRTHPCFFFSFYRLKGKTWKFLGRTILWEWQYDNLNCMSSLIILTIQLLECATYF